MKQFFSKSGFTLVELLVVLAVFLILIAISLPALRVFQSNSDVEAVAGGILEELRLAQNKTMASEGASQYGVYFDTSTLPNKYILFKGGSYSLRSVGFDEINNIPSGVNVDAIDLWGGHEVVFERITGHAQASSSFGFISLKSDNNSIQTVYIDNSGLATLHAPPPVSDAGRVTDSRHIHFDYNREINTTTEKIILKNFSTVVQEIPIGDNIVDGEIYWSGQVVIDGQNQTIKIHTHRFNLPDTQFCIHRDARYNNKDISVYLSGDNSGSLVDFTSAGQETRGTSVNLTLGAQGDPQRQ